MRRYIIKRILISVVTLLLILFILFLILQFMPGSPFNDQKLSADQIEVLKQKYGLDQPFYIRFFKYLGSMLKGDLGVSYALSPDTPITTLIKNRFPITLQIGLAAMLFGTFGGMALGFLTAFFRKKVLVVIYNIITVIGVAVPSYLVAMLLSYFLGFKADIFPLLYDFRSPVLTTVMPIAALAFTVMAIVARYCKAEAMDVLDSDYVLLARCQGLSNRTILLRYILKNSLLPVITIIGTLLVGMLTGSLVIEQMFSIPGIGSLLTTAISANDYSIVIALSFIYSLIYIVIMLFVDILYGIIDPRVRLVKGNK